jgi:hypothetical protein
MRIPAKYLRGRRFLSVVASIHGRGLPLPTGPVKSGSVRSLSVSGYAEDDPPNQTRCENASAAQRLSSPLRRCTSAHTLCRVPGLRTLSLRAVVANARAVEKMG